jgi:hypothetical protein
MKKFEKVKNIEDLVREDEENEKKWREFFLFHFMFFQ